MAPAAECPWQPSGSTARAALAGGRARQIYPLLPWLALLIFSAPASSRSAYDSPAHLPTATTSTELGLRTETTPSPSRRRASIVPKFKKTNYQTPNKEFCWHLLPVKQPLPCTCTGHTRVSHGAVTTNRKEGRKKGGGGARRRMGWGQE